jgi:hypothetical protein
MDIQEHLNKLIKMRQELAGTGASLTEDDFTTIVMSSLLASVRFCCPEQYRKLGNNPLGDSEK